MLRSLIYYPNNNNRIIVIILFGAELNRSNVI